MFTLNQRIADAATSDTLYMPVPLPCRLVKAVFVSETAATVADETITLSDGTTTIGTITVAYSGAAAGDCDTMVYSAAVELDEDTPLNIVIAGTSTSTVGTLVMMFSEYHVG